MTNLENPRPPYKKPTRKQPSIKTLEKWLCDDVAQATDGCRIELDGCCSHGHVSWLVYLGYA
jgi:hypothetical protein